MFKKGDKKIKERKENTSEGNGPSRAQHWPWLLVSPALTSVEKRP